MKKKLKLLVFLITVALTFLIPHLQAMESAVAPITFIQPDSRRMVMKVNLDQSLSDLRSELIGKGRITPDDVFQREGYDIFQDDEKAWTIREVISGNTLFFKPRILVPATTFEGMTSSLQKRNLSEYMQSIAVKAGSLSLEDAESLGQESVVAMALEKIDYNSLSPAELRLVFDILNLKSAINFKTDPEIKIEASFIPAIEWNAFPHNQYPEHNLVETKEYFLSKILHGLNKSGINSTTAGIKFLGINSADIECKSKNEQLHHNQETDIYLLATYKVEKIILSIQKKSIRVLPELETEIEKAVNSKHDINSYKFLLDIFKEYGFCVPTQFVLGGKICWEDTRRVKSIGEAKKVKDSFAASVQSSFQLGAFFGGGGNSTVTQEQNQQDKIQHKIRKVVIGGDESLMNDPARWVASLSPIRTWRVIERSGFYPIIDFLNPSLRDNCIALIGIFYKGGINEISIKKLKNAETEYFAAKKRAQEKAAKIEAYNKDIEEWFGFCKSSEQGLANLWVDSAGAYEDLRKYMWNHLVTYDRELTRMEASQLIATYHRKYQKRGTWYEQVSVEVSLCDLSEDLLELCSKMGSYESLSGKPHKIWEELKK